MLLALKLCLSQAVCRFPFAGISVEHGDARRAVGMLKGKLFLVGGYEEAGARLLLLCVWGQDERH